MVSPARSRLPVVVAAAVDVAARGVFGGGAKKATSVCFHHHRGWVDGTTACDVADGGRVRHCRLIGQAGD